MPIQLLTRQLPPAAFTQDTQHRFGVLHFAYLPVLIGIFKHLAPLALWTALPSALAGRCSYDYYGASVAIDSHPVGDPTFVPVLRCSVM